MANTGRPRITVPKFDSRGNGFRIYREEVNMWAAVCRMEKSKLGIVLWLELPRDDPSDMEELILAKVGADDLKTDKGLTKFLEVMDEAFKPTSQCRELEIYNNYYKDMKRGGDKKIMNVVNRFDKAANVAKRSKIDLPTKVK